MSLLKARAMAFGPVHGASARTEALVDPGSGQARLAWNVRGLPHDGGRAVLLLADGCGSMVVIASGSPSHGGRVRFRYATREDHDLAGRAYRVVFDGTEAVTGNLPLL